MQHGFKKNKYIYLGLSILAVSLLLLITRSNRPTIFVYAADTPSPDVIAVRVMPNPNNYSPLRWYYDQGFGGSPEALMVDGYDAVRDGRTIYVNAGNVAWNPGIGNYQLYTNIYLISYNQNADQATRDILNRVLEHWKFNLNLGEVKTGGGDRSTCSENSDLTCLVDEECAGQGYCNSFKAQITRDVKRLAQVNDIKDSLENYKNKNGYYPILSSGSYVPNASISTWPSWSASLGFPVDPINKLSECSGYDATTCWDEIDQKFAWPNDLNNGTLPGGNHASVYKTAANGSSYNFCSFSESGLNINNKLCKPSTCEPMCYNKECGNDGCGGTCGTCDFGESCFQGKCYAGCVTAPGCRASLANAYIVPGYCGTEQCYNCLAGFEWNGSACIAPVVSCQPDGCNGICPDSCVVGDDPDCSAIGCQPGDGKCDPANECSTGGAGDCTVSDCCGNDSCDAGVGEDVDNCPTDCQTPPPPVGSCIFPFDFPCLFN